MVGWLPWWRGLLHQWLCEPSPRTRNDSSGSGCLRGSSSELRSPEDVLDTHEDKTDDFDDDENETESFRK